MPLRGANKEVEFVNAARHIKTFVCPEPQTLAVFVALPVWRFDNRNCARMFSIPRM
jgi:hypothetical protein